MQLVLLLAAALAAHALEPPQCWNECYDGSFATRQPSCDDLVKQSTLNTTAPGGWFMLLSGQYHLAVSRVHRGRTTITMDGEPLATLTPAQQDAVVILPMAHPLHLPVQRHLAIASEAAEAATWISLTPLQLVRPCQQCRSCAETASPCTQIGDRTCKEVRESISRARRSVDGNISQGKLVSMSYSASSLIQLHLAVDLRTVSVLGTEFNSNNIGIMPIPPSFKNATGQADIVSSTAVVAYTTLLPTIGTTESTVELSLGELSTTLTIDQATLRHAEEIMSATTLFPDVWFSCCMFVP